MPVSRGHWAPAAYPLSWISALARHFWIFRSLDLLWIFQVWPATFKYGRALQSETTKTTSTLQACSFFSNPCLEFCLSTPLFLPPSCSTSLSKHLTLWKFQGISLEHEILWKRCFAWAFRGHFFCCYARENLNIQNSWPHWLWTYHWHFSTGNYVYVYRWQFSTGNYLFVKWSTNPRKTSILPKALAKYFPQALCPPWSISIALLFLEVSSAFHLDFLFANFGAPTTSYHLFSNFRCTRLMIYPGNCSPAPSNHHFSKPPPRVIVCISGHSDRSGSLVFETLVGTRTLHP